MGTIAGLGRRPAAPLPLGHRRLPWHDSARRAYCRLPPAALTFPRQYRRNRQEGTLRRQHFGLSKFFRNYSPKQGLTKQALSIINRRSVDTVDPSHTQGWQATVRCATGRPQTRCAQTMRPAFPPLHLTVAKPTLLNVRRVDCVY